MTESVRNMRELRAAVQRQELTIEQLRAELEGRKRGGNRLFLVGLVVAFVLAAVGGVAYASVPSTADGLIHVCYPVAGGGSVTVIDTQRVPKPQACAANQRQVTWSPNGSPSHLQAFGDASRPVQVAIPANVTHIVVELWGAGGGAGAAGVCNFGSSVGRPHPGGGGGSGAYVRATVSVVPGEKLTFTVGKGGAGGDRGDGTATVVSRSRAVLAAAAGGSGGHVTYCNFDTLYFGDPGAGGVAAPSGVNAVRRTGKAGIQDTGNLVSVNAGGVQIQGSILIPPTASVGGSCLASFGQNGFAASGGNGYAIVSW